MCCLWVTTEQSAKAAFSDKFKSLLSSMGGGAAQAAPVLFHPVSTQEGNAPQNTALRFEHSKTAARLQRQRQVAARLHRQRLQRNAATPFEDKLNVNSLLSQIKTVAGNDEARLVPKAAKLSTPTSRKSQRVADLLSRHKHRISKVQPVARQPTAPQPANNVLLSGWAADERAMITKSEILSHVLSNASVRARTGQQIKQVLGLAGQPTHTAEAVPTGHAGYKIPAVEAILGKHLHFTAKPAIQPTASPAGKQSPGDVLANERQKLTLSLLTENSAARNLSTFDRENMNRLAHGQQMLSPSSPRQPAPTRPPTLPVIIAEPNSMVQALLSNGRRKKQLSAAHTAALQCNKVVISGSSTQRTSMGTYMMVKDPSNQMALLNGRPYYKYTDASAGGRNYTSFGAGLSIAAAKAGGGRLAASVNAMLQKTPMGDLEQNVVAPIRKGIAPNCTRYLYYFAHTHNWYVSDKLGFQGE
jgi:hypothetical protein